MACTRPLTGYYAKTCNPSGKHSISFNVTDAKWRDKDRVTLPCGQCLDCRLERSRQRAIRCYHEASLYERNCFITLTYSSPPPGGTLNKEDFQLFMKRLRKLASPTQIRYYHCGEYGDQNHRPHYHACLFNWDFSDKKYWKTVNGEKYYTSQTLEDKWTHGFTMTAGLTFDSAAYVARYVTKKITGPLAQAAYTNYDEQTGEVFELLPEFNSGSLRPGLGRQWYERFKRDVYPSDEVILKRKDRKTGHATYVRCRPPKYYDRLLERDNPELYELVKDRRYNRSLNLLDDNTPDRRLVKEEIQFLKFLQLKRPYEAES